METNYKHKEFFSGERLYKEFVGDVGMRDHIDRYRFALNYINSGSVCLDAACGSGYGTEILAEKAKLVIGIDYSKHALEYAIVHYSKDNIRFFLGDLNKSLEFPDAYFDVIVCFQTIEHVRQQEFLLQEFQRILRDGGTLIISVPNLDVSEKAKVPQNIFHIREWRGREFIEIINKYFKLENIFGQSRYKPVPLVGESAFIKNIVNKLILSLKNNDFLWSKIKALLKLIGIGRAVSRFLGGGVYVKITPIQPEEMINYCTLIGVARKS